MAHLVLPDAVNAAEPLLDPVRVPRQVVVDHQVGALQVQALTGGVGGDQDAHVLVLGEQLLVFAPFLPPDAAVDPDHRLVPAQQRPDVVDQVGEGVLVLGEDDDLAQCAVGVVQQVAVVEQRAQFGPLPVGAGPADPAGQLLKICEDLDLVVQLRHRARCGCGVDDVLFETLQFRAGQVVEAIVEAGLEILVVRTPAEELVQPTAQVALLPQAGVRDLAAPFLQPAAAAFETAPDGLGAGREAALQHGQREADGVAAAPLAGPFQVIGAAHLLAHVLGDRLVQVLLALGQVVRNGVRPPLREQRAALHREQLFLDHPPHQVARIDRVHAVAVLPLEPVTVQQRQEQLEILLLARVRGRGHEQQVPGDQAERLAEFVALGALEFVAVVVRRHAVRLVNDHQVPVGLVQLLAKLLRSRQLVHPGDQQRMLDEYVRVQRGFDHRAGEQFEPQAELLKQFLLPLLHQAPGGDHQAPGQVTAQHQLLDVEPGHDRLAGSRVVGEQEAQRRARQHLPVDGLDLVRQRPQVARCHGQHRIEQRGVPDPQRLRRQPPRLRIAVECVYPRRALQSDPRLMLPPHHGLTCLPVRVAIRDDQRVRTDPFRRHDVDGASTGNSPHPGARCQLLQPGPHDVFEPRPIAVRPVRHASQPLRRCEPQPGKRYSR